MQRVLITGAAGSIGTYLRQTLKGVYPTLRLSDIAPLGEAGPGEEIDKTDITDFDACLKMCAGVDGIVHLGGQSVEADWPTILQLNLIGLYNVLEAGRRGGIKRFIFATSNHAVGMYRRDQRIDNRVNTRPDSRYGVSKAYGEALTALYADKHGIGALNIRIGNVADKPIDKRRLSIWISPRDLTQLIRIGLEHPELHYEIVYGVSDNVRSWYDNTTARRLGYRPQDRSEDYAVQVLEAEKSLPFDPIAETFMGGTFSADEFTRDPKELE